MSNNAPDYEDNLVFPPQEIKSQDDIKHQDARSSDVLIKAVEKCEKLEQKIKGYKQVLACIDSERLPTMESINWVFENMLDDEFNLIEELDK